ncbi:MAG: GGDEF domain-containing protein [Spirochaetes bacterium]|nr:GGDEF domain-containing protein [Spirochaetota bacterium]MBL7006193.1 GGDEF domain-containing protein [Spirochaetia bacterium]
MIEEKISGMDEITLLNGVLSAVPEPFFVYDEEGTYLDILGGMDRNKYHDARHLIGQRMHDVMNRKLADRLLRKIKLAIKTESLVTFEYAIDPKDIFRYEGQPGPSGMRWFEAHISPLAAAPGEKRKVVWIAFDITRLKNAFERLDQQSRQLREMARIDTLTGLLNRRSFYEMAYLEIERFRAEKRAGFSSGFFVMMMDLDHFKQINDNFGHYAGDTSLRHFSKTLKTCLRSNDVIGRLGGEEFAIIISGERINTAESLAERIRQTTEDTKITFQDLTISFTVSIGITQLGEKENDIIEALKRADQAMYRAKREGRNRICIFSEEKDGV